MDPHGRLIDRRSLIGAGIACGFAVVSGGCGAEGQGTVTTGPKKGANRRLSLFEELKAKTEAKRSKKRDTTR